MRTFDHNVTPDLIADRASTSKRAGGAYRRSKGRPRSAQYVWLGAGLAICWILAICTPSAAQESAAAQWAKKPDRGAALALHPDEYRTITQVNAWTLGIAAGLPEGAPLRFATELARVVDDGRDLRLLPIVTRGVFENVHDLLYLRGVDAAIVYSDVLEHFKKDPKIASIERRVSYLMHLFPSEVHVFARPEIQSLEDLAGKAVNFNTRGTAAAYTGPLIFQRLGINVDARFDPHPNAMGELAKNDKYAAVVFVSTKPLDPFVKRKWPDGFKFLPVPLTEKLEEYYLPAELSAADYPGLVTEGGSVQTIAVPAVLAVYNWPEQSERHRRVERLIDAIFARFQRLQNEAGNHPRWKDLNLAANVPGWHRFKAMQTRLDAVAKRRMQAGSDGGSHDQVAGSGSTSRNERQGTQPRQ